MYIPADYRSIFLKNFPQATAYTNCARMSPLEEKTDVYKNSHNCNFSYDGQVLDKKVKRIEPLLKEALRHLIQC